ncbi:MAG TPA: hypothetical protein DCW68_07420 [Rhodospirillaceae bacterium]|nr:MAG: hypothetical protein A2018_06930 [Alphaproteobacteria bacterium GWF2_58_20]HAU29916.1 hypothetical protein [Rhodospirillaceae bacterium]
MWVLQHVQSLRRCPLNMHKNAKLTPRRRAQIMDRWQSGKTPGSLVDEGPDDASVRQKLHEIAERAYWPRAMS